MKALADPLRRRTHLRAPFGWRWLAPKTSRPAHLDVHEPKAAAVQPIFDDAVAGGVDPRDPVPAQHRLGAHRPGKALSRVPTVGRPLLNKDDIAVLSWNTTASLPSRVPVATTVEFVVTERTGSHSSAHRSLR